MSNEHGAKHSANRRDGRGNAQDELFKKYSRSAVWPVDRKGYRQASTITPALDGDLAVHSRPNTLQDSMWANLRQRRLRRR
jgi:hypothetical protein